MHNARQRAILSALGIRQWVPRAVATKSASAPTVQLWRHATDELAPNNAEVAVANSLLNEATNHSTQSGNLADINPISRVGQATANLDHHSEAVQAAVLQSELVTKSRADQVDQLTENNAIQDIGHFEAESTATINLHSFRLQACEINQWIVLVNEADLQNPQLSTLWKNILLAFQQPELSHFSWPLSEGQRWQRMTGSKAALNGFLFRLGLDKRVGLMSELADEVCPDRIERLPHLSELIEQPLKKRLLWHLLKAQ
ncbi:hypothetical protein [Alkanindiges illinoisensis]|uniref:hypothetical protein n=1 Tax=Alkanindiges illinoisensis TaxID=197183 RepID=UPI00047CEEBC|nr:hypothetical protein [Alkanindiges illinoisensis]